MKKIISYLLCIAMLFTLAVPAFAAEANKKDESAIVLRASQWYIIGNNVNLRSGPGPEYSSGGQVNVGDTFDTTGNAVLGSDSMYWRYCQMTSGNCAGINGWVQSQYTRYM